MKTYTHAVAHRILLENGKQSDHLEYAIDMQHAYAIAHQLLAVGAVGVSILELKEPTTVSDYHDPETDDQPSQPTPLTNEPDQ